ncbi:MAG: hypothetical protein HOF15_09830 [Planctomycetaceae bacterium]|nr:hypothetical protein [Planctomycetaceae bacterium]MBT5126144.1 hypothetical protein [Planctomycetaceae bacterium]MBT5885661.1 hypothetical protein [Planctomycetaceae bacterium]
MKRILSICLLMLPIGLSLPADEVPKLAPFYRRRGTGHQAICNRPASQPVQH